MENSIQYLTRENKLIVRGILVPGDTVPPNTITKMVICASGCEQEFQIEMDSLGRELIKYNGLKAILNGRQKETGTDRKTIIVDRYEIQPW